MADRSRRRALLGCCACATALCLGCTHAGSDGEPPSDTPATWVVREELSIGTVTGDSAYEFVDIGEIEVDRSANVYVWDLGLRRVRKFDGTGQFVLEMGGDGGAPHEFSRSPNTGVPLALGGMTLVGDSMIVVHDPWTPKLVHFDLDGAFHHDVSLLDLVQASRPFERISRHLHDLGEGWLLLHHRSPFGSRQLKRAWDGEHALVRVSSDGASLDTLATFAQEAVVHRWLSDRIGESFPKPFPAEWQWAVGPDGQIAVGHAARYEITIHDRSWQTLGTLKHDVPSRRVTAEDVAAFREGFPHGGGLSSLSPGRRRLAVDVLSEFEFPNTWPYFDTLVYDQVGRLWVRPPAGPDELSVDWDVFDTDLEHLASVQLPATLEVLEITESRIYATAYDDLGVPFVHVYRFSSARSP